MTPKRKPYSTDYKLQVVKYAAENGKKRKRRRVYLRSWQSCSEATPRMKNSMDFSDLKWDGEFVSMFFML